jgi:hypothetical protein
MADVQRCRIDDKKVAGMSNSGAFNAAIVMKVIFLRVGLGI